jgi:hypothetical protein
VENPTLVAGSSWLDAGDPLVRDADATITDVGLLGGALDGYRSQFSALLPFVVEHVDPPFGPASGPVVQVSIRFTRALDPATVDASSFAVTLDGAPVSGTLDVAGAVATFVPDAPLLSGHCEVALSAALADSSDAPLLEPFRYAVDLP